MPKIKVSGYAQRVFYNNGIEYRNFSEDLVGNQSTSPTDSSIFTSGNFRISANLEPKISKLFLTKKFSPFVSLENLQMDEQVISLIINDSPIAKLNLNKSNLGYYAYFGSLTEFIRVSLEDIIIKWPASIHIQDIDTISGITGFTAEDYTYDSLTNKSNFKIGLARITNRYNINHKISGSILNTFNETNDLRNLTTNYTKYVLDNSVLNYNIIGFTGNTNDTDDYIWLTVEGNPFSGVTETIQNYHIRPNNSTIEEFFISLPDFESNLLNRLTNPIYKSKYNYNIESETGAIYETEKELVWPVTDGYNIDFDTADYINFVTQLIEIGESSDITKTNLVTRFLTAQSISDFDTIPNCDGEYEETAGQKMTKTLRIYGREFDEIKKYIDGIAFANTVTYDKKDNIPDVYLKNLARVLGWELVSSVLENDLLNDYLTPANTTYSGQSRGLTPVEAEIELWRRIILNTPWIWKSKGTRKVVEFFFNFIGTPSGLVKFNEYIYKVKKPIDIILFKDILSELRDGNTSLEGLNVDEEGYPRVLPDTSEMYFQKGGLWYRETAGINSNIDILEGNNPHIGPYDGGQEYIGQFGCLIPDFSAVTIFNETISTGSTNIFTNYNSGLINNSTDEVWVDLVNNDNISLSDCYQVFGEIISDPKPSIELTDCGCETGSNDDAIKISINKLNGSVAPTSTPITCGYTGFTLDGDGFVVFKLSNGNETTAISQECCEALGFTYYTSTNPSCYWFTQTSFAKQPCNDYEPTEETTDDNIIIWVNKFSKDMIKEVSQGCCESYGFESKPASIGSYYCLRNKKNNPCGEYSVYNVDNNGVVTWINNTKTTTIEMSPECCKVYGYTIDVFKDSYRCIDETKINKPIDNDETQIKGNKIK